VRLRLWRIKKWTPRVSLKLDMTVWRTSKLLHIAGTVLLLLAAGYIFIFALRQAGIEWWLIFSLSGYSFLIMLLLISVYLFAVFRSALRSRKTDPEHPLTSTAYYMFFYSLTPFLGALGSVLGLLGVSNLKHFLLGIALGTLGGTFSVWIIIDPLIGLIEMLLPVSRNLRLVRQKQAKILREKQQHQRLQLLAELQARHELEQKHWSEMLTGQAQKLARLITDCDTDRTHAESEAVNIGVFAWQLGGMNCMRKLHTMTLDMCRQYSRDSNIIDYISIWWDGIGNWRKKPLLEIK